MAVAAARKKPDNEALAILELERQVSAAERMQKAVRARDSLIDFAQMMMPDLVDPDNVNLSRFEVAVHHRLIAQALKKVRDGSVLRLAISMPPRHGKSEEATRLFPAWCIGANPYWQVVCAGATATFAEDEFGAKIRRYMQSAAYQQIFPGAGLHGGSRAVDNLKTKEGGNVLSIGKGGQIIGRGGDLVVVDDPYAGRDEAFSPSERRRVRQWFTSDVISRMMPGGRIVVIHQRWHEDDLIGWLTDPNHPEHNPRTSGRWMHLYLPAIITDPKLAELLGVQLEAPTDSDHIRLFGKEPLRPLWPERYGLEFFAELKDQDAQSFEALYMGNPVPEDGDQFKREDIEACYYDPEQCPPVSSLRMYGGSDHAVSEEQVKNRDSTCMGPAGMDADGTLWILDDLFWRKAETDVVAEAWIDYGKRYKFMKWFAERGHISKSIGPFLRKMAKAELVYLPIDELTPVKDKTTNAQSIRAMIGVHKVRFPRRASWMQKALDEMLKFPNGKHDDFVSFISMLGLGLVKQMRARQPIAPKQEGPKTGTLAWVKESSKRLIRDNIARNRGGF